MLNASDSISLTGRILISLPFLMSGISKFVAPAATIAYIASVGLPLPPAAYAIAVAIEIGGGLLLLLGVYTRSVAAIMAIFTMATALAFHANFVDQDQMIHFLKNLMITGGLLQLAAFGSGQFSVDARLNRTPGVGAVATSRAIASAS